MTRKRKPKNLEFTREEVDAIMDATSRAYQKLTEEDQHKIHNLVKDLQEDWFRLALETLAESLPDKPRGEVLISNEYFMDFAGTFYVMLGMGLACQLEVKP